MRDLVIALRILGWGATVLALGISVLLPHFETWTWLSSTS